MTMRRMVVRAVVFDIGGVLELETDPRALHEKWRRRVGLGVDEYRAAVSCVDPDALMVTGEMTEEEYRQRWATALGLSEPQADEFMCDVWDWCCGEPDEALMSYAAGLRPNHLTAILSNAGSGVREQDEARYAFSRDFDAIVYSYEVGLTKPAPEIYALTCDRLAVEPHKTVFLDDSQACIDGANEVGMIGVLHRDTAESIQTINRLIR